MPHPQGARLPPPRLHPPHAAKAMQSCRCFRTDSKRPASKQAHPRRSNGELLALASQAAREPYSLSSDTLPLERLKRKAGHEAFAAPESKPHLRSPDLSPTQARVRCAQVGVAPSLFRAYVSNLSKRFEPCVASAVWFAWASTAGAPWQPLLTAL